MCHRRPSLYLNTSGSVCLNSRHNWAVTCFSASLIAFAQPEHDKAAAGPNTMIPASSNGRRIFRTTSDSNISSSVPSTVKLNGSGITTRSAYRQAVRANWCAYAILHPSIRHLPSGERGSRLFPAYTSNLSTRASRRSAYLNVPMPAKH